MLVSASERKRVQASAMPEKGDRQRIAKWPVVEYQSLVLTSFFRLSLETILCPSLSTEIAFLVDLNHFLRDIFFKRKNPVKRARVHKSILI